TAEVGPGRTPHSWFVGYAPADNPRVAVAVIMENRGLGSDVATPAARRIMEAALGQPRTAAAETEYSTVALAPPSADATAPGDPLAAWAGAYCPLPPRG